MRRKERSEEKSIDELIEEGTVDCYDESEARAGLAQMVVDEMGVPFPASVLGERVEVSTVEGDGERVVAVIRKNGKTHRISVLDLQDVQPAKNALLIAAYREGRSRFS